MTTPPPDHSAQPAPRLIVDLTRIQENYRRLQTLAPDAEVGAVVKANAYGLGATHVLPTLAEAGCKTFYVAHTSEGIEAREALAGHEADIFVFNGFWPAELDALRQARLFPVINDLGQLKQLRAVASDLPCAIHFDTGMSRLGLDASETDNLLADAAGLDGLDVRQIMSHLACADVIEHPLNDRQRQHFAAIRTRLPDVPASLANSAGVLLGAGYHADILRPGLALYGGTPTAGHESAFKPVVHIEAPILQLRQLRAGEPVGYGATFRADRPMLTATVAAGYADGLLWSSQNGGIARYRDAELPIIGRVSMDLISVDATEIADQVRPGDWVRFLGSDLDTMAAAAGTLNYEFLVRLGLRFHRVYRNA